MISWLATPEGEDNGRTVDQGAHSQRKSGGAQCKIWANSKKEVLQIWPVKIQDTRSSPVAQWVKDQALSLGWLWLELCFGFDLWRGNFHMQQTQPPKTQNVIHSTRQRAGADSTSCWGHRSVSAPPWTPLGVTSSLQFPF